MNKSLRSIEKSLKSNINESITAYEWHSSIVLEGRVKSWDDVILAGKLSANKGYKGVVNKIEVDGLKIPDIAKPGIRDSSLNHTKVDVLIIGGGIIGCSIARELSKWDISILLVDKEEDIAMHTSSRNDGMAHPGIEPKPGSKKALYNVKGNMMYTQVSKELNIPFNRTGSIVLFDKKWVKYAYPIIIARAKKNGVKGVELLSKEEIKKREKYVTDEIEGAIHFPSTGILSPYKTTIAYGENAVENGAKISLNTIVLSIKREGNTIVSVETNRGTVHPKVVINAAGIYADKIADMANDQFFTIHPRKGETIIFDKKKGYLINSVVAKPTLDFKKTNSKGGGLVKTVDGNILVGPDAYEQPFREDYSTNRENIEAIIKKHLPTLPNLKPSDAITYYGGTRAATYEEDFIIEKSEYVDNLVYAAGIQSPGFASAPAIAEEIEKITCSILSNVIELRKKQNWNPYRKAIPDFRKMSVEERNIFIKENPAYGEIICRCEEVSRGEIIDAIHSPIPIKTVDGIKRRVRPGMGRCQGGFCMPLVMDIIEKETNTDMLSITKKGGSSNILVGKTKKQGVGKNEKL